MRLTLIVAMTRDGLMGRDNALPWHWPEDLRHFKRTTRGHAVVMGRKTFDSLLENFGGPLPERVNVVVSRRAAARLGAPGPEGVSADGARWFDSLDAALAWLSRAPAAAPGPPDEVFILGGAEIFRLALERPGALPERLIVTWVPDVAEHAGDTFFPLRPPEPWILQRYDVAERWSGTGGQLEFVIYARKAR